MADTGEKAAVDPKRELRRAMAELERRCRAAALADMEVYDAQRRVKRWQFAVANPRIAPFLAAPSATGEALTDGT